jgi:hypothetical protein
MSFPQAIAAAKCWNPRFSRDPSAGQNKYFHGNNAVQNLRISLLFIVQFSVICVTLDAPP